MPRLRALAVLAVLAAAPAAAPARLQVAAPDPTPASLDALRDAVGRILDAHGVPGAGIALVRTGGIEWAGGVGVADAGRGTPVTADTRFLAGSISKTFVALALVQLAEEGLLDLDAPVADILPNLAIDNPWSDTDPVRVIHLLQHTAGFDDMRAREIYNIDEPPDLSLDRLLARSPGSRRVRWRPGTRMSYSNPGYAVAARVLERVAGVAFDEFIERRIFAPLAMTRSTFRQTADAVASTARGYADPSRGPVPYPRIYLRPAGSLSTTARDLGVFVRMLLGWGELDGIAIVDPEYLGNMEHPRTTLASRAGLRVGYGTGIFDWVDAPYALLGHGGAIDGFSAAYAYSPARDAGLVVLLNRGGRREALSAILSLGIRYLKRDVAPPEPARVEVSRDALARHEGYYHDEAPRNQVPGAWSWLAAGRTIAAAQDVLAITPVVGPSATLVPVTDRLFRTDRQVAPTHVFTTDEDGRTVLTGIAAGGAGAVYAVRTTRWRVEILRVPVIAAGLIVLTPAPVMLLWAARFRRAHPRGFWGLKATLAGIPLTAGGAAVAMATMSSRAWGMRNAGTAAVFAATWLLPALSVAAGALATAAWREGASRALTAYAWTVAAAAAVVSAYLWWWGLLGFRAWTY